MCFTCKCKYSPSQGSCRRPDQASTQTAIVASPAIQIISFNYFAFIQSNYDSTWNSNILGAPQSSQGGGGPRAGLEVHNNGDPPRSYLNKFYIDPESTFCPSMLQHLILTLTTSHPLLVFPARALRALGLLLADGAPTVGGGKTFWADSRIFLRKQL